MPLARIAFFVLGLSLLGCSRAPKVDLDAYMTVGRLQGLCEAESPACGAYILGVLDGQQFACSKVGTGDTVVLLRDYVLRIGAAKDTDASALVAEGARVVVAQSCHQ